MEKSAQLLLLIGLPIILIAILGTALSSMMDSPGPEIKVKVAFIEHEDEKEQVDRFINDLEKGIATKSKSSNSGESFNK